MESIYLTDGRKNTLLPIYAITVGKDHKQEHVDRPNGAMSHHLLFVQEGEGIFETPFNKYKLKKNTVVFIKKDLPIKYYAADKRFVTAWVTFDGECVNNILEYFSADDFSFCDSTPMLPRLISCVELCKSNAPSFKLSKEIYDMIISYFEELDAATSPKSLIKAKKFILENYCKDLSIMEIASAAGISQSLLFRFFKEKEKCTPIEYLRYVRIERSKHFLVTTQNNIEDIGKSCGFSDSAYFCKVFKSKTGVTPKKFRELNKI